ncbi:MAG: hypothetical protein K0R38_4819 [Polyangiaceae bacterium]|jgi:hypothetical protein|nr:hypothetical protein [Polyangiaceae bacterium]
MPSVLTHHRLSNPKFLALFSLTFAFLTSSPFAKAGQEASRILDVSVVVSRSCTVSTERGAEGAVFDATCPTHAKQSLMREVVLSSAPRLDGAPNMGEHLVLVVNF